MRAVFLQKNSAGQVKFSSTEQVLDLVIPKPVKYFINMMKNDIDKLKKIFVKYLTNTFPRYMN